MFFKLENVKKYYKYPLHIVRGRFEISLPYTIPHQFFIIYFSPRAVF